MDSLITRRGAIAAAKQEGDWVRPSDWLPLPSVSDSEQKFVGLHAIFENANFVALSCQGAYTVDWGDGIVENFASGVTAYHEYNYATYDTANTTLCSRGYKQAIVTITPQAGQNLSQFNLGIKHNQSGLLNGYTSGWLDIVLSAPQAINGGIKLFSLLVVHRILEQVNFKNVGFETSMFNMFYGCNSLQSVSLNTTNVTTMDSMFGDCYSLQSVSLNTANATSMVGMFYNCFALQSVSLNTVNVTNMSSMFLYCPSLQSFSLNTTNVTNMNSMLYGCNSLQSVSLNTANVTDTGNMFGSCFALQSVSLNGLKTTFSLASCKLSATALDNLFTSLGTVSGRTVTISSNYGASTCNRSIATTKGWTVTG